MSVRHINAKPGEYIAVHRHHGSYYRSGGGGGGTGGGGEGCLSILAVLFVIWIIASFWEIILGLVILSVIIWVIWWFRHPIWGGVRLISTKIWNCICVGGKRLHSYYIRGKKVQINKTKNSKSSDYGKIRQHRQ